MTMSMYPHLPRGLTITETSAMKRAPFPAPILPTSKEHKQTSSTSPATSKSPHSSRNVTLPVLNIPTSPLSSRRYKGGGGGGGSGDPSPPSTSTGHPGMPNGLLRMANMQQQSSNPAQPPPKIATKIVPKDLKSQP